jgi:hypothetical protein
MYHPRLPLVPPATTTTGWNAGRHAWLLALTAEREGIVCTMTEVWARASPRFYMYARSAELKNRPFAGSATCENARPRKDLLLLYRFYVEERLAKNSGVSLSFWLKNFSNLFAF